MEPIDLSNLREIGPVKEAVLAYARSFFRDVVSLETRAACDATDRLAERFDRSRSIQGLLSKSDSEESLWHLLRELVHCFAAVNFGDQSESAGAANEQMTRDFLELLRSDEDALRQASEILSDEQSTPDRLNFLTRPEIADKLLDLANRCSETRTVIEDIHFRGHGRPITSLGRLYEMFKPTLPKQTWRQRAEIAAALVDEFLDLQLTENSVENALKAATRRRESGNK